MPKKKRKKQNKNAAGDHMDRKTTKFGIHLIFDAYGCPLNVLNDMEVCYTVLDKLTEVSDMNKLGEPVVVKAESNEALGGKDPGGFSGFLMIQESHISLHTFAKRGFVTVDVYSCKEFDADGTIEFLIETFKPKDYDILKLDRGLKYPKDNIYK
jgi:S-adenosylmethionine decarboxylase